MTARLYGSLALTGLGHGTDRAVLVGLEGGDPETVDPDGIEPALQRIRASHRIRLLGRHEIEFDEKTQLLLLRTERLPGHPNGMRFTAADGGGRTLCARHEFYSIGGGFIVRGGESQAREATERAAAALPFQLRGASCLRSAARTASSSSSWCSPTSAPGRARSRCAPACCTSGR